MPHSAEKFRRGLLLCFTKIMVSKTFLEKRGEYQDFPSKCCCLTVPKKFVGEPISNSLFLGIDKFFASEGYVTAYCRKLFVSQCRNFSYETPLVFH